MTGKMRWLLAVACISVSVVHSGGAGTIRSDLVPGTASFDDPINEALDSIVRVGAVFEDGKQSTGWACVVDPRGLAVMRWDVIKGAKEISVTIGSETLPAKLEKKNERLDIAVIRVRSADGGERAFDRPMRVLRSNVLPTTRAVLIKSGAAGGPTIIESKVSAADVFKVLREKAGLTGEYPEDSHWFEVGEVASDSVTPGDPVLKTSGELLGLVGARWPAKGESIFALSVEDILKLLVDAGADFAAPPAKSKAENDAGANTKDSLSPSVKKVIAAATRLEKDSKCTECSGKGTAIYDVPRPGVKRGTLIIPRAPARQVLTCRSCHGNRFGKDRVVSQAAINFVNVLAAAPTGDPDWHKAEEIGRLCLKNIVSMGLGHVRREVYSQVVSRLVKAGEAPPTGEAMFVVGRLTADRKAAGGGRELCVEVNGSLTVTLKDCRIIDAVVGEYVFAGGVFDHREGSGPSQFSLIRDGFVVTNRN